MKENSESDENEEPDGNVNNICNGEDDELILEGSDLHKYLTSCQNYEIDVYNVDISQKNTVYSKQEIYFKTAPKQNLELIRIILNSNLLMEEDASFLFRLSSEFLPEEESFMYSRKFVLGILILGILLAAVPFTFDSLLGFLSIITGIVFSLFPIGKHVYYTTKYKKSLIQLTVILQETFSFIRKIIRNIYDDDSLLNSKEILQNLKRCNDPLLKTHNLRKKMLEVTFLSSNTLSCLKQLIIISREATFSFMEVKRHDSMHENYIAFCSDNQLQLNTPDSSENDSNHLAELNRLKNIYLLMQSECLRILGLCLLEHGCSFSIIFQVVNTYIKKISSNLNVLRNQYQIYYQLDLPSSGNNFLKDKKSESCMLLHELSRSLKSLLVDVRQLEDYTETNDSSSLEMNKNYVSSNLITIEKELVSLIATVRNLKQYFLHSSSSENQAVLEKNSQEEIDNSDDKVKKINVGFSDFSVHGNDEVFLGCTDDIYADCSENEDLPNYIDDFKPPAAFMYELKSALINKRSEFEQREISTLKTTEDIEAYKSCLSGDVILPFNAQENSHSTKKFEKCSSVLEKSDLDNKQNSNENPDLKSELIACSFTCHKPSDEDLSCTPLLSKNIALAAVNISSAWKNMETVDYFEVETHELSD